MEELEAMVEDGRMNSFVKKEQAMLTKELEKLQRNLGGVREMKTLPQAIFVVDTKREEIAVKEANRLHIPVIGLLDTNSDPDVIDYGIPANDDAIRSVALMCELVADAILAGSGKEQISAEEMLSGETTPAVDVESAAAAEPVTE
jgi:small subunit ribosomal protein S2